MLTLTSCATGADAVATGETFDFVSPNGQLEIFYDPPEERSVKGHWDLPVGGQFISLLADS